jgi:hypothetical protein
MFRYSVCLALYFTLKVKFEWREATIARYIEPLGHFISLLFPIATASIFVANNNINPLEHLPGWCGVFDFPPGCSLDDEVECKQGEQIVHQIIFLYVFLFIIIFSAMLIMVLKVRQTELRMRRYAGGRNIQLVVTKETGKQALLYIGVFCLTFFPVGMPDLLYKVSVDEFIRQKSSSSSTF